ncbi:MAG: ParA family protein [bacterium]|nr:ParA family protein [bacterium]
MDDHNNKSVSPDTNPPPSPRRRTPWNTVEGRVISLVSRKGGVGKTTSAVNLGAALALSGHNVLIVGTDPQCGVCRTLNPGTEKLEFGLNSVFEGQGSITDLAQASSLEGLFFVSPNVSSLEDEELFLENMSFKADFFAAEIDRARNLYDTILIDCPPSLGAPTQAALLASDSFLVPVQAEELCRGSVESLLEYVDSFRDRYFPSSMENEPNSEGGIASAQVMPLALEGLFLTMASEHTRMGRHVAAQMDEEFGQWMFDSGIPRNTRLSEMALKAKPAVIYDRRSKGSRSYFNLADELVERFHTNNPDGFSSPAAPRFSPLGQESEIDFELPPNIGAPAEESAMGGLDRFLAEIGGGTAVSPNVPSLEEPSSPDNAPEMVSLDDLLAEEEDQSHSSRKTWDDWDQDFNSDDPDSSPRMN